jgi:hypothetical protein
VTCCDPNETCCDGTCCNTSTQKCCDDIGGANDGYCCDTNDICCKGNCCDPNLCLDCNSTTGQCESICDPNTEFCCDGTCCKNLQCCIDGNCIDPKCDGCVGVNEHRWECYHPWGAPPGSLCSSVQCIQNIFITATCSNKGPAWPCDKSHCDTWYVDPWQPEWAQVVHNSACPDGIVKYKTEFQFWYGCYGCYTPGTINLACKVSSCSWNPIPSSYLPRPECRKECGTCVY